MAVLNTLISVLRNEKQDSILTFLWEDVHSGEMLRHGDQVMATTRADEIVQRYTLGQRHQQRHWLRTIGQGLYEFRYPSVAIFLMIAVICGILLAGSSSSSPSPRSGVDRSDALRLGEQYAETWWYQNLRLLSIKPIMRGDTAFWHLTYRDINGKRTCVDLNQDVYYVGTC